MSKAHVIILTLLVRVMALQLVSGEEHDKAYDMHAMYIFPMPERHHHSYCMQHCQKLDGLSPPVRTFEEWQSFAREMQKIKLSKMNIENKTLWSSATEGGMNLDLSRLYHWPEDLVAEEGVWRDYYTGERLDNYIKPWVGGDQGMTSNCIS